MQENFDTLADWTSTGGNPPTEDNVNYKYGTRAINLTQTPSTASKMDKTVSWNLAQVADYMRIHCMDTQGIANTGITLFLSNNAGYTKYFQVNLTVDPNGYWKTIQIPKSAWSASGGMTWSDTIVRIRAQVVASANARAITWDGLHVGYTPLPAICITFDDGLATVFTHAWNVMRNRNMVGTAYITSSNVGTTNYMTYPQIKTLQANGWCIANHSRNHYHWNTLTQGEIETEIQNCIDDLATNGITGDPSRHVAYPFGELDADIRAAMAAKGMLTGRTTISSYDDVLPFIDPYALPCRAINSSTTLSTIKGWIDNAVARKEILMIYTHNIVDSSPGAGDTTLSIFSGMIEYAHQSGMIAATVDELYRLQSEGMWLRRSR